MENVVDALKVAFAILIFALAITLAFSVISNIRQTSDVLFEMSDTNKYYIDDLEGYTYTSGTNRINRSVGAETIIPTIYRYYKENFGVTIIAKNKTTGVLEPISRFDLDTENIMNNWQTNNNDVNKKHIDYLNTYINPNRLTSNGSKNDIWSSVTDINNNLYQLTPTKLYIMNENQLSKRKIATPWIGSEQKILQRISADIYGEVINFDTNTQYIGKNLLEEYLQDNNTYTEYFVFVPAEDINKTDKLEIIYVQE